MPAKFRSFEHLLKPDPRYKNKLVGKFINCLMQGGKKSVAQRIFYAAMDEVKKKVPDKEPADIFLSAIGNVKPLIEVRSRRVGGATYQVPVPVPEKRKISLAYRWLLGAARGKKGRPMYRRLADELYAAFKGEGEAMKKREDVHKMAEANKAFAHLAY
jgi:small subunit ribosomal protein S7